MTLKEMRELARKASEEKHKGEEADLSFLNTTGNAGVTHKNVWDPEVPEEKTKEEIMHERDIASSIKNASKFKTEKDDG